jgi:hypothetical protein
MYHDAAVSPAVAQTPGGMVMPSVVPAIVNTAPAPVANPQAPEAPKN